MAIFTNSPRMKRVSRRPQHPFQIRYRPWQIQPMYIAPVLPNETLENLLLQSRIVSDPINNSIVGWWTEYMFFYVKHRDLYDRDKLVKMHLNPEEDMSSLDSPTKVEHYHTNPATGVGIDWVKLCMERVVDEYFRAEGEDITTGALGNLPAAHVGMYNYLDSAINDAALEDTADETLTDAGSQDGAAVTASEIDAAMRRYELMRTHNLTDMTFEDYLATYGVKARQEELHKPELIRHVKSWTYPTNTVEPTTGAPSSAVVWSISERADKKRYFREQGFIFGVTVTRPKVYFKNLNSNAVMLMRDSFSWLPALLNDDPHSSVRKVAASDSPLDANTDAYWIDIKDLFLYGDQFVNFALSATKANIVDLPTAALLKRYASSADADALFVSGAANLIKADGIVSTNIMSNIEDTSPMSVGTNITV